MGVARYIKDENQARRVAWRQIYRWIQSQLALIITGMVSPTEVFLPYMLLSEEKTVYDRYIEGGFAGYITDGKK